MFSPPSTESQPFSSVLLQFLSRDLDKARSVVIQRSKNISKDHAGLLSRLRMLSQNKVSLNHFPSDIDADIYREKLNLD